jgi:hypothetical protein
LSRTNVEVTTKSTCNFQVPTASVSSIIGMGVYCCLELVCVHQDSDLKSWRLCKQTLQFWNCCNCYCLCCHYYNTSSGVCCGGEGGCCCSGCCGGSGGGGDGVGIVGVVDAGGVPLVAANSGSIAK